MSHNLMIKNDAARVELLNYINGEIEKNSDINDQPYKAQLEILHDYVSKTKNNLTPELTIVIKNTLENTAHMKEVCDNPLGNWWSNISYQSNSNRSLLDTATDSNRINDVTLTQGLQCLNNTLAHPFDPENLQELHAFEAKLPSSAYQDAFKLIALTVGAMFFSLAASTLLAPVNPVVAAGVLVTSHIYIEVMCDQALKATFNYAHEAAFIQARDELLGTLPTLHLSVDEQTKVITQINEIDALGRSGNEKMSLNGKPVTLYELTHGLQLYKKELGSRTALTPRELPSFIIPEKTFMEKASIYSGLSDVTNTANVLASRHPIKFFGTLIATIAILPSITPSLGIMMLESAAFSVAGTAARIGYAEALAQKPTLSAMTNNRTYQMSLPSLAEAEIENETTKRPSPGDL